MTYQRKRSVGVNDRGHVVGEDHHRAQLTDHEIDLMRELRAEGMSIAVLADKFDCSRASASYICAGKRRQLATDQKFVAHSTRYRPKRPARPEEFDEFT